MRINRIALLIVVCSISTFALDGKTLGHLISIPIVEGAGVYSSVSTLVDSDRSISKAAAATNLGLMAANVGIGAFTLFGKPQEYGSWRLAHRIAGFALTGAALWLSIATSTDDNVRDPASYAAYGYTGLTAVPVIMFAF